MRDQGTRTRPCSKGTARAAVPGGWRRAAGRGGSGEGMEKQGAERSAASHRPSKGGRVSGTQPTACALKSPEPRRKERGLSRHSAARYPLVVSISRKSYSDSIRFYKVRPAHCPSPAFLSRQPPASFPNWPSASGPARQPPLPPPPGCLIPGHFLLPFLVSPETLPVSPASRPRGGPREPPPGQHWAASPTDAGCPLVFSSPRVCPPPPKKGGLPRAGVSSWGLHRS